MRVFNALLLRPWCAVLEYAVCGNDFVDLCSWVFLGFMVLVLPFQIYLFCA